LIEQIGGADGSFPTCPDIGMSSLPDAMQPVVISIANMNYSIEKGYLELFESLAIPDSRYR
jgi:hypothetical protein